MTDTREIVTQAAREAVAKLFESVGHVDIAADIRAGHLDEERAVRNAILGALAALEAVRAVIRAEALRDMRQEAIREAAAHLEARAAGKDAVTHYTEACGFRAAAAELRRVAERGHTDYQMAAAADALLAEMEDTGA